MFSDKYFIGFELAVLRFFCPFYLRDEMLDLNRDAPDIRMISTHRFQVYVVMVRIFLWDARRCLKRRFFGL